jgi:hypothetical protein
MDTGGGMLAAIPNAGDGHESIPRTFPPRQEVPGAA